MLQPEMRSSIGRKAGEGMTQTHVPYGYRIEDGKIDKVITKSISRFARNTLDCLKYVRKLKELNIDIFFEKENIHTLEASGELLLTIMASLAQANMLFQVSAPAADVGTSTAGLPGTIEVSIPLSGDVAPGLNMGQALVMLQQYQSQNFRWRLSKQSTRCLSARTPCRTFLKKTSRRFLG